MATVNWRIPSCPVGFPAANFGFTSRTIGPNIPNGQGMIFIAPFTGTFTRILMLATAETILTTSILRYGFQGITNLVANTPPGIPNGTYTNSATTDANLFPIGVAPTITNNYIELGGLNQQLVKGTAYSIFIRPDTNWTAGYTISVRAALSSISESGNVTSYHINNATAGTGVPVYAIGTATKWFMLPAPFTAPAETLSTSSGLNNQIGMQFTLPSEITSYKIRGWYISGLRMGFGSDTTASIRLINSADITLQSVAYNFNNSRATQNGHYHYFEFDDTLSTLTGGTTYYLVLQTGNGANNSMTGFTINSNYAAPWQTFQNSLVFRNGNTGPWLSTLSPQTSIAQHDLILEDVTTASSSGGGLIVHPGMTGGMRG